MSALVQSPTFHLVHDKHPYTQHTTQAVTFIIPLVDHGYGAACVSACMVSLITYLPCSLPHPVQVHFQQHNALNTVLPPHQLYRNRRVMSFNVRTSAMDSKDGDNCWDNRKAVVASIVANQRPAVCGMQVLMIIIVIFHGCSSCTAVLTGARVGQGVEPCGLQGRL